MRFSSSRLIGCESADAAGGFWTEASTDSDFQETLRGLKKREGNKARAGHGGGGFRAAEGRSPTIQRVGKATAAPVELDGWERLLLEERERRFIHTHRGGVVMVPV